MLTTALAIVCFQEAVDAIVILALLTPDRRIGAFAFAAGDLHEAAIVPEEIVLHNIMQVSTELLNHRVYGL